MKQSTRIWLGMGVGCGAFVAISYAIFRTSEIGRASAELEDARAEARKAVLPLTLADFYRIFPPAKDSENAAPIYQTAIKLQKPIYEGLRANWQWSDFLEGRLTNAQRATLLEVNRRAQPAMAAFRRGAKRSKCDFHRNWEAGPEILFTEYAYLKRGAKLFDEQAMLQTSPERAVADLEVSLRLAEHVGREPTMMAMLLQISCEARTHQVLAALARRGPRWATEMQRLSRKFGYVPDLRKIVQGEAFLSLMGLEMIRRNPVPLRSSAEELSTLKWVRVQAVRRAFETRIIQYHQAVLSELPSREVSWDQAERAARVMIRNRPSDALLNFMSPPYGSMIDCAKQLVMLRAITRTAIDRQLNPLSALPGDLFGKGLVKINGNLIYSVGINGKDEGGSNRMGADDIAVRFR